MTNNFQQPPDGTQQTIDSLLKRDRSLEYFLRAVRTDILDGLHELDERVKDTSEDPLALAEELGTSAIEYLRSLEKSIATYIGDEVLLK